MKALGLAVLLLATPQHEPDASEIPSAIDVEVVQTVLEHLVTVEEFGLASAEGTDLKVVLDASPPDGSPIVPCARGCLEEGHSLSSELLEQLLARADSSTGFSWASAPFSQPVLVRDLEAGLAASAESALGELGVLAQGWSSTFREAFPDAKGWVKAFLPAYSPDRSEAVVRAWAGPSAHGSLITAYLNRDGQSYRVVWCDIIFFA